MPIESPIVPTSYTAELDVGAPSASSISQVPHESTHKAWKCFDLSPDRSMRECERCRSGHEYRTSYDAADHMKREHTDIFGKDMMELLRGENQHWALSAERLVEEGWVCGSSFEADMSDLTTDTESGTDLGECETIYQSLLRPAVHCLLTAYSSPQVALGNSENQSSDSGYASSFNGHAGASGSRANNLPNLSSGCRRRRNLVGEDDDDEDLPSLACPFVKFDPLKHEKCYMFVLKGISRIK
jgi:hypothetical protein